MVIIGVFGGCFINDVEQAFGFASSSDVEQSPSGSASSYDVEQSPDAIGTPTIVRACWHAMIVLGFVFQPTCARCGDCIGMIIPTIVTMYNASVVR